MAAYPQDWLIWADGTLLGISAPADDTNLLTLWDWSHAESGSDVMRWNNPLNTTQPEPGAVDMNSVGVKRYPDIDTGVLATVTTLLNGFYPAIVSNLRESVPQAQWSNACHDLGTWGTGCGWIGAIDTNPTTAPAVSCAIPVCTVLVLFVMVMVLVGELIRAAG